MNESRHTSPRVVINDTEEENEYNPTQGTKGVTNNSVATHNNRHDPFIDEITKTPLYEAMESTYGKLQQHGRP